MSIVGTLALNTFREAVRNKILYSVVLFAALLLAIATFFGSVTIGSQIHVVKDFGLFALSFGGMVLSTVAGVNLLNKEIKQKTIYNILSKPVCRWQFVVGKFVGLYATVAVLLALMGLCFVALCGLLEGRIDLLLFQGLYFALLESAIICALTIFFSSIVITTTLSAIFTIATYIAGRSLTYVSFFLQSSSTKTVSALAEALRWTLPDLATLNIADEIVYGVAVTSQHFFVATLYSLSYCGIVILLSIAIFQKRELV